MTEHEPLTPEDRGRLEELGYNLSDLSWVPEITMEEVLDMGPEGLQEFTDFMWEYGGHFPG